jgi:hypothetical protein
MKIKALENIRIATDDMGFKVATAQSGEVFDIEQGVAELLIRNGQAAAVEEKQVEAAPENKMVKKAPAKKGK